MLKLGIVGSGFIAHFHAQALRAVRGFELAGVCSPRNAGALAQLARSLHLGDTRTYSSVTEMAKHVDVVAVYCPNFATVATVEEIASARKAGARVSAVICEKPLGRNVREARRIVEVVKSAGLRTAYFENQIHMKAIKAARLQSRPQQLSMGPLALVRCAEEHSGPHNAWFWDPVKQGGGVLSDMGCHSIAVGWHLLTPPDKPLTYMQPIAISCEIALLKWGLPKYREELRSRYGVDFASNPAEDYASGTITFRNPDTKQITKLQFTDSWMYDKQGLRLFMEGLGPGYAFEVNSLQSPLQLFIGDAAANAITDQEAALEKSTASRGLLSVQPNEPDLYGYTDENLDAHDCFAAGVDAMLPLSYGLEINKLVMAAYMAAEQRRTLDLTDAAVWQQLDTFVPLVQQGRGKDILF